jgi:hypothetical protein
MPSVVTLQSLPSEHAARVAEKWWIAHGQMIGWDLVNGAQMVKPFDEEVERQLVEIIESAEGYDREAIRFASSIYERTRSWDAVAKSFFERDPEQTQSDLRRLMVLISADGRGPDAFKGEAYRLYHQFNPKGNSYRANQ